MVGSERLDSTELFERRALGMLSDWFFALEACRGDYGYPHIAEGMLHNLHNMTEVLIEIGARLEEAGPVEDTGATRARAST